MTTNATPSPITITPLVDAAGNLMHVIHVGSDVAGWSDTPEGAEAIAGDIAALTGGVLA